MRQFMPTPAFPVRYRGHVPLGPEGGGDGGGSAGAAAATTTATTGTAGTQGAGGAGAAGGQAATGAAGSGATAGTGTTATTTATAGGAQTTATVGSAQTAAAPVLSLEALAAENARLRQTIETELAASRGEREADVARRRRDFVKRGMSTPIPDTELDKILPPGADPLKDDGAALLGQWRAEHHYYYPPIVEAPRAKVEDLTARIPKPLQTSSLFGPDSFRFAHTQMHRGEAS